MDKLKSIFHPNDAIHDIHNHDRFDEEDDS